MGVTKQRNRTAIFSALLSLAALGSNGCSDNSTHGSAGTITIDGSTTVAPLTAAMTQAFGKNKNSKVEISLNESSTGKGFEKFCEGEIDIANASRPISETEILACKGRGIEVLELPIAYGALTVVVNPGNTWVKSLKIGDLRRIWHGALVASASPGATPSPSAAVSPDPTASPPATKAPDKDALPATRTSTWNEIRSDFPEVPLRLFGPIPKSGNYDFFEQVVGGKTKYTNRTDYLAGDYDLIAKAVSSDQNAIGYISYGYYLANKKRLKAVPIDSGKGPIEPTNVSIQDNSYKPFSNLLFIYVSSKSLSKPQVKEFVDYYIANVQKIGTDNSYIPLPTEAYPRLSTRASNKKFGSVFEKGKVDNLNINDIIKKF
jgi:phosphate transport system substrate-binding protein